ncbi:Kelch-like protein 13-like [Homarus americanus]|uniref:Kelch-like protein 13-like n=1 Tax=Homarus americanus TaxID=6706 RepID=A0A8J5MPH6_HOMAM|nr:Kelch-like protein 13-like [Homarus americanus]
MMDTKHFVWGAQIEDLWEVASELQENAIEVDVYLRAMGSDSCIMKDTDRNLFTSVPSDKCFKKTVTFPAHKLMLAAASPFLNKVLSEHYHEHRDTCVSITVPHVSPNALHYVIDFIYCGNLDIPMTAREQVLEAAQLLQVISLIDYIQSDNSRSVGMSEAEPAELKEKADNRINDGMKSPSRKRGRKRKLPKIPPVVNESFSVLNIHTQKKADILNESKKYGDDELGRCRRKIKNRYNSDIYEVNIPKLRRFRNKELYNTVKKKGKSAEHSSKDLNQSSKENENHHTYALNTNVCKMNENVVANVSLDKEVTTSSPSFTCTTFDLRPIKTEDLEPHLLPLPSTLPSSSVVMPHLFTSDASYLQESSRSQCLTDISCAPFIEPQDSKTRITEESFESSTLVVASSSSSSSLLLSHTRDLSVTSLPALQSLPLKQVPAVSHPQNTSDTFQDEKNEYEEEEEDGLLKWQVRSEILVITV